MPITSINLSSLNGMNGFRLDGITRADSFGGSVSNAGDVNGDGFDDVIVGAMEPIRMDHILAQAMWYLANFLGSMPR